MNVWDILNNRDLTAPEKRLLEVLKEPNNVSVEEDPESYIYPDASLPVAVKLSSIVVHFNNEGYTRLNNASKIDKTISSLNGKGHNIMKIGRSLYLTGKDTFVNYYVEWLSASCTLKGSVHRYLHIPILGSVHRVPFIVNST